MYFLLLWLFLILSIGSLAAYVFYKWATKNNKFFAKHKIIAMKPEFLFGNSGDIVLRKKSPGDFIYEIYNEFPKEKIIGFFDMRQPTFLIRDPELIKYLAVKNFDHFEDHRVVIDENLDPLFGKSLPALSGHAWKEMRGTLTPAFTENNIKLMFDLISKCGNEITNSLLKEITDNNSKRFVEMKDLFTRFSNDVIATCAFGIEVNSLKNNKNDFYNKGKRMTNFGSFINIFKQMGFILCPSLMKMLRITYLPKSDTNYFRSILTETLNARKKQNIVRNDMINLLMTAQKGQLKPSTDKKSNTDRYAIPEEHDIGKYSVSDLTNDDIVSQCLFFFFAGHDIVSTTMAYIAFELAINLDVQEILMAEVDNMQKELKGGKLTYDALQKMEYLDKVATETLRKWPPGPMTDRVCVKDFHLKQGDLDIKFKKGDNLLFPIFALHRDQKYYPYPLKFDPDRFSDENKHEINPLTYLPFGIGPRNCIGSRFALMETKAIIYYVLLNFTFDLCWKTAVPVKMGAKKSRMVPDEGIWLEFIPRKK